MLFHNALPKKYASIQSTSVANFWPVHASWWEKKYSAMIPRALSRLGQTVGGALAWHSYRSRHSQFLGNRICISLTGVTVHSDACDLEA